MPLLLALLAMALLLTDALLRARELEREADEFARRAAGRPWRVGRGGR